MYLKDKNKRSNNITGDLFLTLIYFQLISRSCAFNCSQYCCLRTKQISPLYVYISYGQAFDCFRMALEEWVNCSQWTNFGWFFKLTFWSNKLLSLTYLTQSMADPLRNISIAYTFMDGSISMHRFNETKKKSQ